MRVTLDTNVLGPVACPEMYPTCRELGECKVIRGLIMSGQIEGFVSEASLGMEALENELRLDEYLREISGSSSVWKLPTAPSERQLVFSAAFELGIRVLSVTRVALPKFVGVPDSARAAPFEGNLGLTQERCSYFMRKHHSKGAAALKAEGARLVRRHGIPTGRVQRFHGIDPEEAVWAKGLVAEYDKAQCYPSRKAFLKVIRRIIAEWNDVDALASHYAYGLDVFCTLDDGKGAGADAILRPANRPLLRSRYGVTVERPSELVLRA